MKVLLDMKVFIVVDVGCIECGEKSRIIGVFRDRASAKKAENDAREAQEKDWMGQHNFFIQAWDLESNTEAS